MNIIDGLKIFLVLIVVNGMTSGVYAFEASPVYQSEVKLNPLNLSVLFFCELG